MVELTRKTNVMMSFSVEDTRRVDQLLKHLAKHNIPYFEFRRGIEPGQDIIVSVLNAIDLCTHVFIYVSPASVNSPWVWFEVGIGTALGRSLVFVLDHPSTKLPLPFNHLRYVINDKEYVDYVRTLGRMGTPIKSGQKEMSPVEHFAKSKLYYHEGGWARAIRLWGAEDVTFPRERVNIKYDHIHLSTPAELLQEKQQAIAKRKEEASRNNSVFFDGPNTRMLGFRVSPENEYSALEIEHLMLHLGPVGWYDYVGLNEGFRAQFETSDAPLRVYEYYVGLGDLVTHGDVSKSRLSNIVESAATIITADGHLIYGQRTGRVMGPNKFTCAVAENINRYLDDTDPSHPMFPLNLPRKNIDSLPDAPFDSRYIPAGVPDPFAAVRRGLSSEISPGVYEAIPTTAIRITGIAFDLDIVHPTILFVIFAPISMDELFTLHEQKPGRETYEVTLHSMKADSRDPAAVSVLRDRDWVQSGKASVLRALEVIEASRRIHRCSLPDAIETIVRS